jgi:hypothetical protein
MILFALPDQDWRSSAFQSMSIYPAGDSTG